MAQSADESEMQSQRSLDGRGQVDNSRRAALRQCSSIFATAFASVWTQQEARASEFSESPDKDYIIQLESKPQPTTPQFGDETVITPIRPRSIQEESSLPNSIQPEPSASATVASNPSPTSAEVTLENSQTVTIPTKQVPVSNPAQASSSTSANASPKESGGGTVFIGEVAALGGSLGALYYALTGKVEPNTDELSPKAKVVMIENEPYGLANGRRWYKGVDITINDPIPASDVRQYCEAGTVNNDCTETITGFLGDVSANSAKGDEGPSMEQQETATVVLSYLDSLKASPASAVATGDGNSETSVAFTTYLNGLSYGEINAPSSPQAVANYLDAISGERISTLENRVNALESSVDQLPDEISGRVAQLQDKQDERLAQEFTKIESYLMNNSMSSNGDSSQVNGANGANGVNGVDGMNGANGANGVNGVNGMNGANGANGVNGMNGANGINSEGMKAPFM
eukprot:CAMPEP_0183712918 /NCGR_PEP_ID=MMETSP0737-20130205/7957_1 /TAXON_ID=385413 /ORGANISM="Thalassiosira miniscula, Strain CCMP1093" /LENGTH=459 /DNA_ID=CAMNT_0025941653 /DNA_START=278 /DNA_END=1657 /DNA_ORIENTATION=+